MPSSNLRYICAALAALILLVALPTLSHAHRSSIPHELDLSSDIFGDRTKSLKDSSLIAPQWVTANVSLTVPLARHAAVIIKPETGETLCAIAGGTVEGDYKEAYCYPLRASGEPDISRGPAFSLTEALRYLAATVVDNRIYILGGRGTDLLGRDKVYCVEHNTSGTWMVNDAGVMAQTVMQHAAVTVDDRIYVIGGYDTPNFLADVWSAKVVTGCVVFGTSSWRQEAPLRARDGSLYQVSGHAAVAAILDNDKKFIYVIGGLSSNGNPMNKVLRAKVGSDGIISKWDELGSVDGMPGTWLLSAVAAGRHLYVLGGTTTKPPGTLTSSDKVYSAEINDDGSLAWDHSLPNLPIPLYAHATAASKSGYIYVVGGISSNIAQQKIYFIQIPPPWLSFEKQNEPSCGPIMYGDTISYTLKLTNLGVRELENLTITDTVQTLAPAALIFSNLTSACYQFNSNTITCSVPSLTITETNGLTFQVTISEPTSTLLSAPPSLPAWLGERGAPSQGRNVGPDLSLQNSSAQSIVTAGKELTYTLVISNAGPSAAQNIVVRDDLPNGVTFESATPPPSSLAPLTWSWDSIPAGEKRGIRLTVRVNPGSSGILTNTAFVSSNQPDPVSFNNQAQTWVFAIPDSDPDDYNAEGPTAVNDGTDISLAKSRSPSLVIAGDRLTYTLVVSNAGPSAASNVTVIDPLPPGTQFVTATTPVTATNGIVTWTIPTLLAGQSEELELLVQVSSSTTGYLLNIATVASDIPDTNPRNNTGIDLAIIYTLVDLSIEKHGSPNTVVGGDTLVYALQVINNGPSDARNVVVTDTLPAGVTFYSSMPASTSGPSPLTWYTNTLTAGAVWTITVVVTIDPNTSGLLTNMACTSSNDGDANSSNNCDTAQTLAPVSVINTAYVCEGSLWCQASNTVMNTPFNVYLPIIFKTNY